MIKIKLIFFCAVYFVVCGIAISSTNLAAETKTAELSYNSKLSIYKEKANRLSIHSSKQWLALLYYLNDWFGGKTSIIDDQDFFFSPHGKHDAKSELFATLDAFFKHKKNDSGEYYQCLFPARFYFLTNKLEITDKDLERKPCEKLKTWLDVANSEKVYLAFSSFYAGNPGSLFGHTFLRFKRKHHTGELSPVQTDLLDIGVNYAAHKHIDHPLLTVPFGLFGGFKGHFSMGAYYLKVQEYNNAEQRDLWEYELNYTPEQIKMMILSLGEVGRYQIDYYYFDDNCSLIMLALLDVGNPEFSLADKFNSWVIPGDTVKKVAQIEGIVKSIKFRPSTYRKYLNMHSQLTKKEQKTLKKFLKFRNSTFTNEDLDSLLSKHSNTSKSRIIETIVEFIDYEEKLAASNKLKNWKNVRQKLLIRRAAIEENSQFKEPAFPTREQPHLAHGPTRLGLSHANTNFFGRSLDSMETNNSILLNWRPALHDIGSDSSGYSDSLAIDFLDLTFRLEENLDDRMEIEISNATYLKVFNLGLDSPLENARAWRLQIESHEQVFAKDLAHILGFGLGLGGKINLSNTQYYALLGGDIGRQQLKINDVSSKNFVGLRISVGARLSVNKICILIEFNEKLALFSTGDFDNRSHFEASITYMFDSDFELLSTYMLQNHSDYKLSEYALGASYYF